MARARAFSTNWSAGEDANCLRLLPPPAEFTRRCFCACFAAHTRTQAALHACVHACSCFAECVCLSACLWDCVLRLRNQATWPE
eukprot:5984607-Alexandrium_andersonii.AAC.1